MTFLLFSLTVFFSPATSETKPDPVVSSLIRIPPSLCSVKKTTISFFSTSSSVSSSFCLNPKIHHRFQPMEFPLVFQAPSVPHPPTTASFCTPGGRGAPFDVLFKKDKRKSSSGSVWGGGGVRFAPLPVRASEEEGSSGGRESSGESASSRGGFTGSTMEVRTFNQGFGDSDFPAWERIGAVVRMSYGIGIYAAMALAGKFICSIVGIDYMEGFQPSFDAVLSGLGYATPPIMALLFILDDEVVRLSPHARAIRDVEDEELRGFFYGMSPWQFILTVAASSVGEELFYRAAVQGALSDIFLRGTNFVTDARGMVSLTGVLPPFVPFAQAFAAVVTAALTGSLYYVVSFPTDPTYVVAPVLQSRSGKDDLKKLFAAWYERRQMKKIYSPLLEGLLALYLGFEWIQTDNILAPIITHGIYSTVILGHGLWKIHDHRRRLRQRVRKLKSEGKGL